MATKRTKPSKPNESTPRLPSQAKPVAGTHLTGKAKTLSSRVRYAGSRFTVTTDQVTEPGGVKASRDIIRHNGSVVILAVDTTNAADPSILLIRQFRYATNSFLLELPAGHIEKGEKPIPGAKRELIEETGYRARRWSRLTRYYASPGFLTEAMNILLAEDLILGQATPEDDERIEVLMTPLSEVLRLIHAGKILDGKTLIGVLYYASTRGLHS